MTKNKAVLKAYTTGTYVDKDSFGWYRGLDGWFMENSADMIILLPHADMVELIEKENPE